MNDRQWEILSFRLSAIEEAVESIDRKMDELAHISQLIEGPPKEATCGTCRWMGETYECLADPPGGEPYIVDNDTPCCRHWRPK